MPNLVNSYIIVTENITEKNGRKLQKLQYSQLFTSNNGFSEKIVMIECIVYSVNKFCLSN